jgi:hypothetical protein
MIITVSYFTNTSSFLHFLSLCLFPQNRTKSKKEKQIKGSIDEEFSRPKRLSQYNLQRRLLNIKQNVLAENCKGFLIPGFLNGPDNVPPPPPQAVVFLQALWLPLLYHGYMQWYSPAIHWLS